MVTSVKMSNATTTTTATNDLQKKLQTMKQVHNRRDDFMSLAYHTFTDGVIERMNWQDGNEEKWEAVTERNSYKKKLLNPIKIWEKNFIYYLQPSMVLFLRANEYIVHKVQNEFYEDDIYEKWKVEPAFFSWTSTHTVCSQFSRNENLFHERLLMVFVSEILMLWSI